MVLKHSLGEMLWDDKAMTTATNDTQTECLTPEQVAERLQVSRATVVYWLRTGRLRGSQLGYRTWRVTAEEMAAFLARETVFAGQT